MTEPNEIGVGCAHLPASLVATGALVRSRSSHVSSGAVRWCPECGALRSETFGHDGQRVLGGWMHPGNAETIAESVQALHEEAERNTRRAQLNDGLDAARQALGLPLQGDHA